MLFLADFALQEQQEDTTLFLGHGIKAHIPWPLCQSNPGIALYNDPVFSNNKYLPCRVQDW